MTDYSDRLRKSQWAVRSIPLAVGEALIEREHYAAGCANTATYRHGLYELAHPARIRGVALWMPPTRSAAASIYPEDWRGVLALSRLAIEPDVPKNAATFLLARSRRLIDRARWPCLVTYADEGQGHDGLIYRLDGWTFDGFTKPEPTYSLEGRMIARKAGPKTRTHDEMMALGCKLEGRFRRLRFLRVLPNRPLAVHRQERLI